MKSATILLFGFSKSAIETSSQLKAKGYQYTIIDNDASLIPEAQKRGLSLDIFDYTNDAILHEKIGNTSAFIFTLFDDDAKNVFLILSLKALEMQANIITITHTKDAIHKLNIAGANTILDPYQISGKKIYKLITQPEVMNVIDATLFGYHDLTMEQITITEDSKLNHCLINDIYPNSDYNVLLIGIHDKELQRKFIFITEGHNHKLDTGDILVLIGQHEEIVRYKKDFRL